jgi:peptidoglycan/xylan/chitin deacetylase (PgdA/CDA1 family)
MTWRKTTLRQRLVDRMNSRLNPKNLLFSFDSRIAELCLSVKSEKGVLLSFLFHCLFENEKESRSGALDPQQGITVGMFKAFVSHFHAQGYRFVSPEEIPEGLTPDGKYVLLTFDDGYHNNVRALPILEEFSAPAVFFISSGNVKHGKAFWWDVVYREGKKRGRTDAEIGRIIASYKKLKTEEVEVHLKEEFGENALRPVSDLDRPFTPSELRDFANHRRVFLGNHTKDHAILSNYSETEIGQQICEAQNDIQEMTGRTPKMIAYPNGNESAKIRNAAEEVGLRMGVGVRPGHNRLLPKSESWDAMALKRFTLWSDHGIEQQCRSSRSNFSLYRLLQGMRRIAARPSFPSQLQ